MDFAPGDDRAARLEVTAGIEALPGASVTAFPGTFGYRDTSVLRPGFRLAITRLANAFHARVQALLLQGRADGMVEFEGR